MEPFLDGFEVVEEEVDDGSSSDTQVKTMGRIAVASKDYRVGDTVLVEPPFLVFDPHLDYTGMMDAYVQLAPADQDKVMDMYCPPLPEDRDDGGDEDGDDDSASSVVRENEQQTRRRLEQLEQEWNVYIEQNPTVQDILSLTIAKKIMRIIDCNAHNYFDMEDDGDGKDFMALFALGSKVEHSCAPNLAYTTQYSGKFLQYTATQPIARGERVSISYDTTSFALPRAQRQEFLQQTQDFTCHCQRCLGLDECNPHFVSCDTCQNTRAVAFSYLHDNHTPSCLSSPSIFRCISCQSTLSVDSSFQQSLETKFVERLEQLQHRFQSKVDLTSNTTTTYPDDYNNRMSQQQAITDIVALQKDLAERFHPLHWLHARGYQLKSSLAKSLARGHTKPEDPAFTTTTTEDDEPHVKIYLYLSVLSLLQYASWIQQVAAMVYYARDDEAVEENDLSWKQAAVKNATLPLHTFTECATLEQIEAVADNLIATMECTTGGGTGSSSQARPSSSSILPIEMAKPLFQAGQDWLMAGRSSAPYVAKLYGSFDSVLLQRWMQLGKENRHRMNVLIQSRGVQNLFPNHHDTAS